MCLYVQAKITALIKLVLIKLQFRHKKRIETFFMLLHK